MSGSGRGTRGKGVTAAVARLSRSRPLLYVTGAALLVVLNLMNGRMEPLSLLGFTYWSHGSAEGWGKLIAFFAASAALLRYRRLRDGAYLFAAFRMTVLVVLVWEVLANLDVMWNSARANYLCHTQGGLRVYRTAEVDGFLGSEDISYWAAHGFSYVEDLGARRYSPEGERYVEKRRVTLVDGAPHVELVSQFVSRYQHISSSREPMAGGFTRSRRAVVDRVTGEAIAELTYYHVPRGWVDTLTLALLPGSISPWLGCKDAPRGQGSEIMGTDKRVYGYSAAVKAALRPMRNSREGDRNEDQ